MKSAITSHPAHLSNRQLRQSRYLFMALLSALLMVCIAATISPAMAQSNNGAAQSAETPKAGEKPATKKAVKKKTAKNKAAKKKKPVKPKAVKKKKAVAKKAAAKAPSKKAAAPKTDNQKAKRKANKTASSSAVKTTSPKKAASPATKQGKRAAPQKISAPKKVVKKKVIKKTVVKTNPAPKKDAPGKKNAKTKTPKKVTKKTVVKAEPAAKPNAKKTAPAKKKARTNPSEKAVKKSVEKAKPVAIPTVEKATKKKAEGQKTRAKKAKQTASPKPGKTKPAKKKKKATPKPGGKAHPAANKTAGKKKNKPNKAVAGKKKRKKKNAKARKAAKRAKAIARGNAAPRNPHMKRAKRGKNGRHDPSHRNWDPDYKDALAVIIEGAVRAIDRHNRGAGHYREVPVPGVGSRRRVKHLPNGRKRIVLTHSNGVRIITIRAHDGGIVRRIRRFPDGRTVVLIDNRHLYNAPRRQTRSVPPLPSVPYAGQPSALDAGRANSRELKQALTAPLPAPIERSYSLEELRQDGDWISRLNRVDVKSITFATGSAEIDGYEVPKLSELAGAMHQIIASNPREVFMISGHTDLVGDAYSNLELSNRRAGAIADALIGFYAIPAQNLITQGYGEWYPVIPTPYAERQNRRVSVQCVTPLLRTSEPGPSVPAPNLR